MWRPEPLSVAASVLWGSGFASSQPASQPSLQTEVNKRARPPSAAIVLQPSAIPARAIHSPNISLHSKSQSHCQIRRLHRLDHNAAYAIWVFRMSSPLSEISQQSQPDHARAVR